MRTSRLATFILTLSLVAATLVSACSPERPGKVTQTAVPSDMPGARSSSAFVSPDAAIEVSQPLPGTVVTNTVTVLGTGQPGASRYHVDLESDGQSIADVTVSQSPDGASTVFSATLTFEPVAEPADAEIAVYAQSDSQAESLGEPKVVVPVRLAPASMKVISGPVIRLNPESGKAGTNVIVLGEGFPAGGTVEIRLSGVSTEATEHAYVAGTTTANGDFKLGFTMPAFWPNGDPIVSPEVLVVASTPDFVNKATAVFAYSSSVSPEPLTPGPGDVPAARSSRTLVREHGAGGVTQTVNYLAGQRRGSVGSGSSAGGSARPLGLQGAQEAAASAK